MGYRVSSNSTVLSQKLSLSLSPDPGGSQERRQTPLTTVEARAAQLMDDLFQELDLDLDPSGTQQTPHVSADPAPTSRSTLATHSVSISRPAQKEDQGLWVPYTALEAHLEPPIRRLLPPSNSLTQTAARESRGFQHRLWFCLVSASLVVGVLCWISGQLQINSDGGASATKLAPAVSSDRGDNGTQGSSSPDSAPQNQGPTALAKVTAEQPRVPELKVPEVIGVRVNPSRIPEASPPEVSGELGARKSQAVSPTQQTAVPVQQPPQPILQTVPYPLATHSQSTAALARVEGAPQQRSAATASPTPVPFNPQYKLIGFIGQTTAILAATDGSQHLSHVAEGQVLDNHFTILKINADRRMITVQRQGQTQDIQIDKPF